jgi:hypothetical protein
MEIVEAPDSSLEIDMRYAASSIAVLVLLTSGCSAGDAPWAGSVEALPGGGSRVRSPAAGLWPADGGWALTPEVRIVRTDGVGPDLFGRIGALAVDDGGRIWVIEAQAREVRVFDGAGAHVRSFGREGEGPGEFREPSSLLFDPAGGVWIRDARNRRYSRWDTTGVELETRRMEMRGIRLAFDGGMTADGRLFDVDQVPSGDGGAEVPPLMMQAGLGSAEEQLRAAFRTDGAPVEDASIPLPRLDSPPVVFAVQGVAVGAPFMPRIHWFFDPGGWLWFGSSDRYRIVRRSFAGDTAQIIERDHEPLPVTSQEVDAWLAGRGPQRVLEAGGSIDRSRIPSTRPVFEDLIVDDEAHLWVRMVTADDVTFDVFDPEGRYLGPVSTPDRLALHPRPVIRGNKLYAVVRDSLDVPYIVRYAVLGGN